MTKRCSDDIIEIEIEAVQKQVCSDDSLCGQVAEFVSQSIDIGEPIQNLKKLLEPRLQCSLENHHICLQDIQLDPTQSLFDQGVKTDGIVQLSVQVISRQGVEPRLNILEIIKPVETVEVVIDPDAAHHEDMTATQVITVEGGKALSLSASDEASEQVTRWAAALEGFRSEQEREGIPFDPVEWTSAQVLHWAAWVTKEFQLGPLINTEGLQRVDGAQLCSLNQELFLERVAHGEILWSHLELLRKYVQASQDHVGAITTVCIEPQYQIIPGPIVSGSPGTISVIGGAATATAATATKSIKPNRAPRISGEDRSSPGNRTGNNGQIQLWQFLLELLTDREARDCICWVGDEGEFKLNQPEHVAQRWGQRKNKPTMNYEKLSRALRYYYDGDMICKVQGKRFVYKFVCDLKTLIGYSASELNRLVLEAQQREERRLSRIHIHQQQ